jgi:hypothetical protein
MPKIGGFSFSSVPRPGIPLKPRRRGFFRHHRRLTFVARGDVDLVTFHHAGQDFGRARRQDAGAQLFGHGLHVTDIEVELAGDLRVRQVQAHEVEAQDPDPQRLMMAGENCVGQVIEARLTGRAAVTLALGLPIVMTMPGHLVTLAYRATHAFGPPQTVSKHLASSTRD